MNDLRERLEDEWTQLVVRVKTSKLYTDSEHQYHSLNDRDRNIVNVATVVLGLFLFWQLLVGPALGYLLSARDNFYRQVEDYEWMEANAPVAKERLSSSSESREGSLLSIASATAKDFQLSFSRFEPLGDDRVRLWMERVEFSNLVNWLGRLESDSGVSAIDISLDSPASGYVSVRLTLQG